MKDDIALNDSVLAIALSAWRACIEEPLDTMYHQIWGWIDLDYDNVSVVHSLATQTNNMRSF